MPFRPAQTDCPDCQAPLQVYKTQRRTVQTLPLGRFSAHETLLHCEHCPNDTLYAPESLSQLVPSGCTFGYDVLVFVGQALFLRQLRIPTLSDTCSNPCRTAFRGCRTVFGAKRRTERVIKRCPTGVKFSPRFPC